MLEIKSTSTTATTTRILKKVFEKTTRNKNEPVGVVGF